MLTIAGKLDSELLSDVEIGRCGANCRGKQRRTPAKRDRGVRAGPVWQSHGKFLLRSVGDRYDLVKRLLPSDHAEIGTSAFFGRVAALLEIDYLGIERAIAITQRIIESPLLGNRVAQPHGFSVAVVRKPELGLQTETGDAEQN